MGLLDKVKSFVLGAIGILACILSGLIGLVRPNKENPYPSDDDSSELSKRAIGAVIRGCYERRHNHNDH